MNCWASSATCLLSWKSGLRPFGSKLVRAISRAIGQPTHFTHPDLLAENDVLPGVTKAEFSYRRKKLMEQVGSSHVGMTEKRHLVIIPGASIQYMSADAPYRFHQNTDLLYLCGLMEPECVLLLDCPGGSSSLPHHKAVLFVQPRDAHRELWDGPRLGADDAVDFTGVDEAYDNDKLGEHLEKYSTDGYTVWYNTENSYPLFKQAEAITDSLTRSEHSKVRELHDPSFLIAKLRLTKSKSELDLMRQAGKLTGHAFRSVMAQSRPGINEAHLESMFEHSVKMGGAQWMSFPPVVAGGNRANTLHYITNNRAVDGGDLVLMDAGCEYHGYASDVTRTWPISGKFSAAQQALYEVVLETKNEIIKLCEPGVTLSYLHSETYNIMINKLKEVGLLPHSQSKTNLTQIIHQMFPHHVSHWLGLDTHDVMLVERKSILSPGMVVTIEPGLYLSQEIADSIDTAMAKELVGTGVRLEDDVVVTAGKAEVLNIGCPETIQELSQIIGTSQ